MNLVLATPPAIERAARLLAKGGLVAFPTETVYGLGANACDGRAVARVFAAKGRPRFNPLIVHVPDTETAARFGVLTAAALALARQFWPGALTLVVPRLADTSLSELVSAGLPTVALRVPRHPVAQALLRAANVPVAAPSANRSGHVSSTTAAHVAADLGDKVDMILDGGACPGGIESTIVKLDDGAPVLLRAGAIPREDIERVLGERLTLPAAPARPEAPGGLASHYAPRARLRLNALEAKPGEVLLGFGPDMPADAHGLNLSPAGDLVEAAANLFAYLRALDETGARVIAVMPIPNEGLGEAINDRLARAAAPREAHDDVPQ